MKSFFMYTIAVTGGHFRPTPITVLLERGEGRGLISSRSHTLETADQKKKDRRKQYSGRRRQMQADSVSLVDVTQSLDNNISPPKLIGRLSQDVGHGL